MVSVLVVVLSSAAVVLAAFVFYLIFCAFVVVRTGSTACLHDVAVAIRAFSSPGSLTSRWRRAASSRAQDETD